jgi:hypothetical protein
MAHTDHDSRGDGSLMGQGTGSVDDTKYVGQSDHEDRDVRVRNLALVGLSLVGTVALLSVLLAFVLNGLKPEERPDDLSQGPLQGVEITRQYPAPPAPRLQTNEYQDLATLDSQWNEILESYGYMNRQQQTVHIPIDRAMDILANERKLPARQGPEAQSILQEGFYEPEAADWTSGQNVQSGR